MANFTYLVLIETSGNQAHLFDTNRLAENVGASQQLYLLGTSEVLCATSEWLPNVTTLDDVLDAKKNPPLGSPGSAGVEIWYLSSGKSMIFTKEKRIAARIVNSITRKSIADYPGVVVQGAIAQISDGTVSALENAVHEVHRAMESKRSSLTSADSRFNRLPVAAPCTSSGLPASHVVKLGDTETDHSEVSFRKRYGPDGEEGEWRRRILERLQSAFPDELNTATVLDHLESWQDEEANYVAVVHADGNGIGKLFTNFGDYADVQDVRDYIDKLRRFSWEVDVRTRKAFKAAVRYVCLEYAELVGIDQATHQLKTPALPLILGGDDVTLICTAGFAVVFVPEFLRQFESQFEQSDELSAGGRPVRPIAAGLFERATGVRRVGMTAGVAYVKPHYPFYLAYEMAEGLLANAKRQLKQNVTTTYGGSEQPLPASAFDFHVHHSAGGSSIAEIREEIEYQVDDGTYRLFGGPYVTSESLLNSKSLNASAWVHSRSWRRLQCAVNSLTAVDPEDPARRRLPNSQMHRLRTALFEGPNADHQILLIAHRYGRSLSDAVLADAPTVWSVEPSNESSPLRFTRLLDAMSLAHLGAKFNELPEVVPATT